MISKWSEHVLFGQMVIIAALLSVACGEAAEIFGVIGEASGGSAKSVAISKLRQFLETRSPVTFFN